MSLLGGEVQESEVLLPIVSQIYKLDLDRTRSHYIPKVPFDVTVSFASCKSNLFQSNNSCEVVYLLQQVVVHTPNGLPAKNVPVEISVSHTKEKSVTVNTNNEGVAFYVFNLEQSPQTISVEVSILKYFFSIPELSYHRHFIYFEV